MSERPEPPQQDSWLARAQRERRAGRFRPAVIGRLGFYLVVLGYLGWDLYLGRGPLRRALNSHPAAPALRGGVDSAVTPVSPGELRAELLRQGWRNGEDYARATPTRRLQLRREAMEGLATARVLAARAAGVGADPAAVEAEWRQLVAQWGGPERAAKRLEQAGWSEASVREGIARDQAGAAWLEAQIAPELDKIGEEQARAWFDRHSTEWLRPRRARFGQVFAATLRRDPEEVRVEMEGFRARGRREPASFALALARSEDERSKAFGGDLGWIEFPEPPPEPELDSLPAGLRAALAALPDDGEALLQSGLGWHWIWLEGAWQPAQPRRFEELRDEIVATLRQQRRMELLAQWRAALWAEAAVPPGAWAAELPPPWPGLPEGSRALDQPPIRPGG